MVQYGKACVRATLFCNAPMREEDRKMPRNAKCKCKSSKFIGQSEATLAHSCLHQPFVDENSTFEDKTGTPIKHRDHR